MGGPGPEHPSTPRSRWIGWPVITTAAALVGAGVSAYYLSKDGDCKDGTTNPACEPVFETKTGANNRTVIALPHDRLREVLKKYNRLVK